MDGRSPGKGDLREPLNPPHHCTEANPAPTGASDGSSAWASGVALCFLAINCGVAIYHSRRDPSSVLFVVVSFVNLVLLFHLLRVFERLPPGSPKRLQVKAAVWALTTTLTVMFSQRVAALMPAPVAAVVWAMAAATILAGFCMFFVCRDDASATAAEKPGGKLAEGP